MKNKLTLGIFLIMPLVATTIWAVDAPPVISLWSGDAPGSERKTAEEKVRLTQVEGEHVLSGVHHPSLEVFLPMPDQATGAAVAWMNL